MAKKKHEIDENTDPSFYQIGKDMACDVFDDKPSGMELIQSFCSLLNLTSLFSGKEYRETVEGIADAFLEYEVKDLDIIAFNKDMALLKQDTNYRDQLRLVDTLLLRLEHETDEEAVIEFPEEIRPKIEVTSIFDKITKGKIGRVYMEEEGMNMRFPHCDVYSARSPKKMLLKNENLLYSKVVVSEVLKAIQTVIDPERKNDELAKAINDCEMIENRTQDPLYSILSKHGLAAMSLSSTDSSTRYRESNIYGDVAVVYLTTDGKVMAVLEGGETVQITQTIGCYDRLVDSIKRAVNITNKKVSCGSKG